MSTTTVSVLVKRRAFRYLWLKAVTGFRPEACCAKALPGRYRPELPFGSPTPGPPIRVVLGDEAPVFYLCGVSFAGYARNVHVPFEPAAGESFVFENEDLRVEVEGARRLAVPDDVEGDVPTTREQRACRNFRFGAHYFASRASAARNAETMSSERP